MATEENKPPVPEEKEPTPDTQEAPGDQGGDWFVFEKHMKEKDENFISTLNPPATEKEVRDAESALGVKFPPAYEKLLKIHNGQNDDAKPLFGRYMFSPLSEVLKAADEHSSTEEPTDDKEAPTSAWKQGYIPFAVAPGGGDALVINTTPGDNGETGQIITFYKADDNTEVLATDFETWLGEFITEEIGEVKKPANAAMEGWFGSKK